MWVFLVMIYLRYLWKEISYKGESIWNLALIGYFLDSNLSFHFVERIGSFGKADVHCSDGKCGSMLWRIFKS